MRGIVFLLVLAGLYKWPLGDQVPGSWGAVVQGLVLGAIVCTLVTPSGWTAIRRIKSRIDGSYVGPPTG